MFALNSVEQRWAAYKGTSVAAQEMEPMSVSPLGAGAGSPTQYLPGFLLGGESPTDESVRSPSNLLLHHHHRSGSSVSTPARPAASFVVSPGHHHLTPDYNRGSSKNKVDGPPIVGLFDDITNRAERRVYNSPPGTPDSTKKDSSNQENNQEYNTEGPGKGGFWVVIYGFPPSHAKEILAVFTQLGRVMEQSFPNVGNWLFLKYQSRIEVRKALAYNEKIVCGNIMIGVAERRSGSQTRNYPQIYVPFVVLGKPPRRPKGCEPPSEKSFRGLQQQQQQGPVSSPILRGGTPTSPQLTPKIRHLGIGHTDNRVVDPHLTPKKDTSVVSKAFDLFFGW